MIVLDQVCIISDRREHLRLIVSKDLSNLSFASLTAVPWPHVQMKIAKDSLESHWLVLFNQILQLRCDASVKKHP
jgi:hypothetical protein